MDIVHLEQGQRPGGVLPHPNPGAPPFRKHALTLTRSVRRRSCGLGLGSRPSSRATTALVGVSVPDRGSNPRVLHLPSIQGGAQITIYVRLGNPFGERNGELLPLEHRATLQGADEVGEIGDETMVDSCSDDKTGRRGGLTPSCHAPIHRGTQRDARRHTGKPTESLLCKTPRRRRQRRETTTLAGGSRAPERRQS